MGRAGGHWLGRSVDIAGGARNAVSAGLSVVRERFADKSLFILASALDRPDPLLLEAKEPTCLAQEIPSYIYREVKDGQTVREEPAPGQADHAADALRYGCLFLDDHDWQPEAVQHEFNPNSYAAVLDHASVWGRVESGESQRKYMQSLYGPVRKHWSDEW